MKDKYIIAVVIAFPNDTFQKMGYRALFFSVPQVWYCSRP